MAGSKEGGGQGRAVIQCFQPHQKFHSKFERVAARIQCRRLQDHPVAAGEWVIRSDGGLAGYRWGVNRKKLLLQREQETVPDPTSLFAWPAAN